MAKAKEAETAQTPGTNLAAPEASGLTLGKVSLDMLAEDGRTTAEDLGIRAQDIAIPFIKVAQKMTPQLSGRDPSHIEGLEEGDFFNSVTGERWSGADGIQFIPCAFKPSYTEWKPRDSGGGLVKDHGSDGAIEAKAVRNDKGKLVLPDSTPPNNHLVPSYMYYGLIRRNNGSYEQVVLNLYGSQLKKGKRWNALMLGLVVPADKSPTGREMKPKPYYKFYEITTVPEKNDQGEWMGMVIQYGPDVLSVPGGDELYIAGRNFAELVRAGRTSVKLDDFADDVAQETAAAAGTDKAF